MTQVEIQNLGKHFYNKNGEKVKVLDNLNLKINQGDFVCFFGPNGCGKTTLINLISGTDMPDEGNIKLNNVSSISHVFQDYRETLLPWKPVWENIALPLTIKGTNNSEAFEKVKKHVSETRINIDLQAFPFMLSGGQAQMVGVLRALILKPDVIIFDEPFSALDYTNHLDLMIKIRKLYEKNKFTVLFISHNIDEAIFLGNKLVLFSDKPTKILKTIKCNLPERRHFDLMTSKKFSEIKSKALKIIRQNIKNL